MSQIHALYDDEGRKLCCITKETHWGKKLILNRGGESHLENLNVYIVIERFVLKRHNYANPVCCVATVCHQVCCMYWGHLGHFHRAISDLKWYKIVCMRYLVCTFRQMKSINMFSMFLQSGVPRHFLWKFIAVWIYNLTVFMFMYVNVDLKLLAAIRRYLGIWDVFMLRPPGKLYLGFG